jgi:DNA invertase Pin-like site-specific DNA recombinase
VDLVAYIRVSKVGGRAGDSFQSPDQQRKAINSIVSLTPGARIVREIEDLDQSGGSMDRPGVKEAIELVESGKVDGIVVYSLDRWARTVEALSMIERWASQGKTFISAHERFDPLTPQGKFALGMMLLVAKYYRDQITERWAEAERSAISRGVHVSVPFGYRRSNGRGSALEVVPEQAEVVRRIFAERLAGRAHAWVASQLNRERIKSPTGRLWNRQGVRAITKCRTYMGEAGKGEIVNEAAHEAIVKRSDWKAVQTESRVVRERSKHHLVGLVRCAGCGFIMGASALRGHQRWNCNRHHAELRCPSPTTAPVDRLDALVVPAFLSRYADVSVQGGAMVTDKVQMAQAAADAASEEFKQWRDDTEMRSIIGDADYRAGLAARKYEMDVVNKAVRDAIRESQTDDIAASPDIWESLDLAERRELLAAGIECVVIHRASGTHQPLAERVEIIWPSELDHDGSRSGIAASIRNRPRGAGVLAPQDAGEGLADALAP